MATEVKPITGSSPPQSPLGPFALAVILSVLLVDAAAETFVSGSPVRWWVAGIVAAYVALAVFLWQRRPATWQRIGSSGRASASFFLLLALLTFTAWLPGGLSDGMRLLGQPTSRVLSLLAAAVIALAGASLVRLSWLPRWAKVVVGLLTAYGLVAFLKGIISGTEFAALLHGDSLWTHLPSWLQGSFLALFVLAPLGVCVNLSRLLRESRVRPRSLSQAVLAAGAVIIATGAVRNPGQGATLAISQRGPGLKVRTVDTLQLPVPRTFDLTHVQPEYFAAALGNDPLRIFDFVRDQIGYESYEGCLRGPRGTLLALAGNSVDRASLLASMLQPAGQRVRFAHGTLPEPLARELATSMWAERPQPASPVDNPTAESDALMKKLVLGVKHDFTLIRDQLKQANVTASLQASPGLDSLTKEAQDHYWIQWSKGGNWVDLDPSFVDSTPGTKYTTVTDTSVTLADGLFHRVEIRVRVEEYTGDQVSNRVILGRKTKAADLSGVDVIIAHQPENWTGPVTNLQSALASGITATGRIKPVLIVGGEDWAAGQPFYTKTPPSSGMGGVFNALAGIGTRNQAPIATAGWVEVEFISPAGNRNIVTREIFDLVGEGRRYKGTKLTAEELRSKSSAEAATDITTNIYSLFFTTGRIATSHLYKLAAEPNSHETFGVDQFLRRISILFAASSDALLKRIGRPERAVIVFYPDSPRVEIADLSSTARTRRFSLDLRRTDVRAVALGPHPESVFSAQVLRGVVEGTLERSLTEYVMGNATKPSELAISTSLIFERARAKRIGAILLLPRRSTVIGPMSNDTGARVREDLANGFMVVAPEQQILLTQTPRFAWWRIEPGSGKTTAVTDEGIYQSGTEFTFNESATTHRVTIGERALINGRWITETARETVGPRAALAFVEACLQEGAELSQILEGWTV